MYLPQPVRYRGAEGLQIGIYGLFFSKEDGRRLLFRHRRPGTDMAHDRVHLADDLRRTKGPADAYAGSCKGLADGVDKDGILPHRRIEGYGVIMFDRAIS